MIPEAKIDEALAALFGQLEFTAQPAGLYDPLRYMIAIGGKRLRPRLALLTYSLYQDVFTDAILQPAAALEVFHNYTLIHDDVMDRSDLRRGVPTVWKKWNLNTAILSGDAMFVDSFRRMSALPQQVMREGLEMFCNTAAQVMEGQQYDMEFETRRDVTRAQYMEMIGLKTGVLLACASKLGALVGGASQHDCDSLYEYGYNLGLAFQVTDDYLDEYGDEQVFGKPIGGDIVNGKQNWLAVHAREKADPAQREALERAFALPVDTPEQRKAKIDAVMALYAALGIEEDAKYEILRLNEKALEFASAACSGIRLESLRRFAEKLVGRSR